MCKRTLVWVTLVVFTTNITGCATHTGMANAGTGVFAHEASKSSTAKIEYLLLSSKIRRIVMTDHKIIQVDTTGVFLDRAGNRLIATDLSGQPVEANLKDVWLVQSANDDVITFDDDGGQVDPVEQMIIGRSPDDAPIRIPLAEVCYLSGTGLDTKISAGTALLGVAGAGIILVGAKVFVEGGSVGGID